MVKAIFFDIDGTLVSFETHKIPASTQEALKTLRDKGIKIFIATGRPQCLINNLGDLEFDGYITVNGSYCFTAGHQPIYKGCIPQEDIELPGHAKMFRQAGPGAGGIPLLQQL